MAKSTMKAKRKHEDQSINHYQRKQIFPRQSNQTKKRDWKVVTISEIRISFFDTGKVQWDNCLLSNRLVCNFLCVLRKFPFLPSLWQFLDIQSKTSNLSHFKDLKSNTFLGNTTSLRPAHHGRWKDDIPPKRENPPYGGWAASLECLRLAQMKPCIMRIEVIMKKTNFVRTAFMFCSL